VKADQADEEEDKVALPPGLCTRARRHESSRPHARTDVMSVRVGVEGARARVGGSQGAPAGFLLLGSGRFGTLVSLKTGLRLPLRRDTHALKGRERARATGSGRVQKRRATRRAAVRAGARHTAFGSVMPPLS
jgi:hypothetical protein